VKYKLPNAEDFNNHSFIITTSKLVGRFMAFDEENMIFSIEKSGI